MHSGGFSTSFLHQEVLGLGRFLLAPWPQSAAARQRVLDSLRSWLTNEAAEMAHGLRLNGQLDDPEQAEHVFLLVTWLQWLGSACLEFVV